MSDASDHFPDCDERASIADLSSDGGCFSWVAIGVGIGLICIGTLVSVAEYPWVGSVITACGAGSLGAMLGAATLKRRAP